MAIDGPMLHNEYALALQVIKSVNVDTGKSPAVEDRLMLEANIEGDKLILQGAETLDAWYDKNCEGDAHLTADASALLGNPHAVEVGNRVCEGLYTAFYWE